MSVKHTYYSGNSEHANKKRIYLTSTRQLLNLLHDGKVHVFKVDQRVEWISDKPTLANEGRLKVLCDKKRAYADNYGIYRLA